MKKLVILGVIALFLFCAPKKTTVKTEGLEEVVVFGEEEKNVSEEPIYPIPAPAVAETTTTTPTPTPEVSIAPPTVEEAVSPLPIEEVSKVTPPAISEETIALPPIEEVTIAPPPLPSATTPLPMEEVSTTPPPPPTPAPVTSVAPTTVYGFRVQIFASSTQDGANKVANDARGIFGGKVYIEHTPPYFKVRVGDCLTKEDAESLKSLAINKGFRGAFVVETMITP